MATNTKRNDHSAFLENDQFSEQLAKLLTGFINDWLLQIQEKLKIQRRITTKVARHSCATILNRAGAGIEFIKDSLGHTTSQTTKNYLDSFENDVKKKFTLELSLFNKKRKKT